MKLDFWRLEPLKIVHFRSAHEKSDSDKSVLIKRVSVIFESVNFAFFILRSKKLAKLMIQFIKFIDTLNLLIKLKSIPQIFEFTKSTSEKIEFSTLVKEKLQEVNVHFSKVLEFRSHSVKSHFSNVQFVKVLGKDEDENFSFLCFVVRFIVFGLYIPNPI